MVLPPAAATTYDIRYSPGPINAGNWDMATQVANESAPAVHGTNESLVVDNLNQNQTYYFAMKTADEVPTGRACPTSPPARPRSTPPTRAPSRA